MENEEETLNTESNDIAGNRIDGPLGNTAAKPGRPGHGTGIPGGPPTSPAVGGPAPTAADSAAASVSSESLAASEMSAGHGGVDAHGGEQENKEANPANLTSKGTYGGNFGNSVQDSYRDEDRRENQDSDPNRGEFGAQDLEGTTHGGFGNQNRLASYEPKGSAEDQYYGGAGSPGVQDNAYRSYDGRNERPDDRLNYGFERGTAPGPTSGEAAETGHVSGQSFEGPNGDNRNQPDRTDANSAFQVDNGSVKGPDSGYANDYGNTSLRNNEPVGQGQDLAGTSHRNQTENYRPAQADADKQGHKEQHPGYSTNAPEMADQRGQQPDSSLGYGDRGREEPRRDPDFRTGNDRNGYVQGNGGDASQGMGSKGGSYNDAYDDSQPGSKAGSPAQGDQRLEDRSQNYGGAARAENRSESGEDNAADHGAPRRNAGRDGEGDE